MEGPYTRDPGVYEEAHRIKNKGRGTVVGSKVGASSPSDNRQRFGLQERMKGVSYVFHPLGLTHLHLLQTLNLAMNPTQSDQISKFQAL